MSVAVDYKGYYTILEIPEQDFTEWKETLKGEVNRIYNALMERIPDETTFKALIAESSHDVWKDFVSDTWEDKDFVLLKHKIKLLNAYPSWKTGIDNAFNGTAPYFPDRVDNKADKFKKVKYTLGAVGLRYKYGRGIAVKAIGVITGWKAVLKDIKSPDEFTGEVVNVFLPGAARFVRAQAIPIIARGLVLAQYAHEAGEAALRDSVISTTNNVLSNTVLKQVDSAAYTAVLEIGFDDTAGKLYVHSSATPVT